MNITFIDTRSRRTDGDTSRQAAKHAASGIAAAERRAIVRALQDHSMTAKELAEYTGINYWEVSRRLSECAGIVKTSAVRDKSRVWMAI